MKCLFMTMDGYSQTPKEEDIIKTFISLTTSYPQSEDIVLDFFAGSGTTAHVLLVPGPKKSLPLIACSMVAIN